MHTYLLTVQKWTNIINVIHPLSQSTLSILSVLTTSLRLYHQVTISKGKVPCGSSSPVGSNLNHFEIFLKSKFPGLWERTEHKSQMPLSTCLLSVESIHSSKVQAEMSAASYMLLEPSPTEDWGGALQPSVQPSVHPLRRPVASFLNSTHGASSLLFPVLSPGPGTH